ncbi:hypothetical protein N7457_003823 [Penicillium paradoxum]|uniref:uncharacterized protein n=1 Tax=Penicillium paradoxum TaxID=176176 RepID=UPI00254728ED|nr:uncharacterized protein N7457_003823 [Penicillium paradoxum]KAJ5782049.1 hypothetical protein N7457_003823 [Penicillium paradoxum]
MASMQKNMMFMQKASCMLGLRRAAIASPSIFTPLTALAWQQQVRLQTTKSVTKPLRVLTPEAGQEELARQRLRRPVAPHLAIYKFQVHSVSSAMERNTGLLLAGSLYLFSTSYLVAPWLGWDLSSATLVAAFGALPLAAKLALKFSIAWPFTFHLFNGIRYLVASTGRTLENRSQIVKVAWAVIGSSAVAAVGLVAYF